jgi:hypothetical protein
VCFLHGGDGGMEYANATTTSEGALAHEVLHAWFARSLTPASDADGWWDEAFTTYRTTAPLRAEPFDFSDAPLELCSRRPFQRRTPPAAYPGGSRFFRGVAYATGIERLDQLMRVLYLDRNNTPLTTCELEEYLVAHSGRAELVDAFHQFVYGFEDPGSAPRLGFGRLGNAGGADAVGASGLPQRRPWVRRLPDGGATHQGPDGTSDGWVHVWVTNLGLETCRHFVVVVAVRPLSDAEPWRHPHLPGVAAVSGFDLGPLESRIVAARIDPAYWATPRRGAGVGVVASLHARRLHPPAGSAAGAGRLLTHRAVQVSQTCKPTAAHAG